MTVDEVISDIRVRMQVMNTIPPPADNRRRPDIWDKRDGWISGYNQARQEIFDILKDFDGREAPQ